MERVEPGSPVASRRQRALGRGRVGGLRRRPSIRKKFGQTILRKVRKTLQHVAQVDERVVFMTLATRNHAEKYGHRLAAILTANEQPDGMTVPGIEAPLEGPWGFAPNPRILEAWPDK